MLSIASPAVPASIEDLGERHLGPFGRCVYCPVRAHPSEAGTWLYYGGNRICPADAWRLAALPPASRPVTAATSHNAGASR